jgi:hypothetical protein
VYVTREHVPLYLDMLILVGAQYTKVRWGRALPGAAGPRPGAAELTLSDGPRAASQVRRRQHAGGKDVLPGLRVFEEIKLDNVPPNVDFNALALIVFDSQPLTTTNTDVVVTAHGWKGAMTFADVRAVRAAGRQGQAPLRGMGWAPCLRPAWSRAERTPAPDAAAACRPVRCWGRAQACKRLKGVEIDQRAEVRARGETGHCCPCVTWRLPPFRIRAPRPCHRLPAPPPNPSIKLGPTVPGPRVPCTSRRRST